MSRIRVATRRRVRHTSSIIREIPIDASILCQSTSEESKPLEDIVRRVALQTSHRRSLASGVLGGACVVKDGSYLHEISLLASAEYHHQSTWKNYNITNDRYLSSRHLGLSDMLCHSCQVQPVSQSASQPDWPTSVRVAHRFRQLGR